MSVRTYCAALSLLLGLGVLLLPAPAASSRSVQAITAPANRCDLAAYVIDPDPQGLNVRSGPGKQFAVIGKIPRPDNEVVGVNVVGSTGQWLQIRDAHIHGDGETLFEGPGWVYGPMLATQTRSQGYDGPKAVVKVYKAASVRSAMVSKLPPGVEVKFTGCKGSWAQIQSKGLAGWLDGESQCANTLTTCA